MSVCCSAPSYPPLTINALPKGTKVVIDNGEWFELGIVYQSIDMNNPLYKIATVLPKYQGYIVSRMIECAPSCVLPYRRSFGDKLNRINNQYRYRIFSKLKRYIESLDSAISNSASKITEDDEDLEVMEYSPQPIPEEKCQSTTSSAKRKKKQKMIDCNQILNNEMSSPSHLFNCAYSVQCIFMCKNESLVAELQKILANHQHLSISVLSMFPFRHLSTNALEGIINAIIHQRYRICSDVQSSIVLRSSIVYRFFQTTLRNDDPVEKAYEGKEDAFINDAVSMIESLLGDHGLQASQVDFIYIPLIQGGYTDASHYTLHVIDINANVIRRYDSLGGDGKELEKTFKTLPILQRVFPRIHSFPSYQSISGIPKQTNQIDCGMYMLLYLLHLLSGRPIPKELSDNDINIFRYNLLVWALNTAPNDFHASTGIESVISKEEADMELETIQEILCNRITID